MNKLKKLQADYQAGKLTKAQYEAAVKALLDGGDIDQAQHDEGLEYDPDGDGDDDKAIYTQADMDRTVMKKARALVRKQLKDAGVDLADVSNNDLFAKVVEMVQAGANAGKNDTELQKEVTQLRAKVANADKAANDFKAVVIENAVLKAAGKYQPYNAAQVVRALNGDYTELLEYDDETGALIPKSVDRALKRVVAAEPNLFQNPNGDGQGSGDNGGQGGQGSGFQGKGPGGGAGGQGSGSDKDMAAKKAKALEMMGYAQKQQ